MAKVTINKSTSSAHAGVEKSLNRNEYEVYDSDGKRILIKIPSLQDEMRFDLYFGKYESENPKFYRDASFFKFVKEIDGREIPYPTNESEILALAGRLGNDGLMAVLNKLNEIAAERNEFAAADADDREKVSLKK